MEESKDPFEVAFKEQEQQGEDESPRDSPVMEAPNEAEPQTPTAGSSGAANLQLTENEMMNPVVMKPNSTSGVQKSAGASSSRARPGNKNKEEEEDEEEENMDVELGKFPSTADPDKMAVMKHCCGYCPVLDINISNGSICFGITYQFLRTEKFLIRPSGVLQHLFVMRVPI